VKASCCGCGRPVFFPEAQVRVWLYTRPADMRKSYDGLSALVRQVLHEDPTNGHLFVFINRKRTQMKVLYFDRSGYCVWSKRLERGRFQYRSDGEEKMALDWTRLKLLLEGIDLQERRQYKRYSHTQGVHAGI
jgi:transposase